MSMLYLSKITRPLYANVLRCQGRRSRVPRTHISPPRPNLHVSRAMTTQIHNTSLKALYFKSRLSNRCINLPKLRQNSTAISTAAATIPDPEREDLYYHLFEPPHELSPHNAVFALSFLSEPPLSLSSCVVIGWLPALPEGMQAGLNDFSANDAFVDILHEAVRSGLTDDVDDIQRNAATQFQEGWMHIHDERNPPALGRIGDPDDIIGSVRVENGKILPETYQPMPSYRLCTSDGVVHLTEGLQKRLKERLQRELEAERS